jgi:hypothetical protein
MNVVVKSNWKILPLALKERHFRSITTATVDGELWHTVRCKPEVSAWVRSQPGKKKLWFENMTNYNTFDLHPTVYTMMCLKWT